MNYRHAYRAGNFADVLKHTAFSLVVEYLKRKEAPFRIIDTHAGRGRYALDSVEADKTGEWRTGIGRFLGSDAAPISAAAARLMAPYLDAVRAENGRQWSGLYPGSPLIARRLMREQDTLIVNELHPEERLQLQAVMGPDRRVKVMGLDGWTALKSLLPPKERRGVVLIDPPFEEDGELARLVEGLEQGLRRFATGVYLAWYPIKDPRPIVRFHDALAAVAATGLLAIELLLRRPFAADRLNGCGLVVANPPHSLNDDLAGVMPEITRRVGDGSGAHYRLAAIAGANKRKGGQRSHAPRRPRRPSA